MKTVMDYTLYLVTDRGLAGGRPLEDIILESVQGGVTVVQLREKELCTRDFLQLARELQYRLSLMKVPLVINDRVDIALACGAAGVHLGQSDMDCTTARRIAGPEMVVGVSVSRVEEALRAEAEGADYLGVSPVFDTATKTDTPAATGLEGLRSIRGAVGLPLVAIGGINIGNAGDVVRNGADGIAVVSAIMSSSEPGAAARELRAAIAGAGSRLR